ncbi:unnamed protein product [Calypogeia fissa]
MAFYNRARANCAHQARHISRQTAYDQDNHWSEQDARSNTPQYRNTSNTSRAYYGPQYGRGGGAATGIPSVQRYPETINFHRNMAPDHQLEQEATLRQQEQYGYTHFSNPMWSGSEQHRIDKDLQAQENQRMEYADGLHTNQRDKNTTVRSPRTDVSTLSKRLGLQIPRVEIPRGDIPADQLPPWAKALRKSEEITKAKWGDRPKISINMNLQEAADYTQHLLDHALIGYFTTQCPLLDDFSDWIHHEFSYLRGWKISKVKFVGKSFYLILFENPLDRQQALTFHPWKYNNRFVYFLAWEPEFNVSTGQYTKLPVWVEITYRDLNLEPMRIQIAEALGTVLMYLQEDEHSIYPHDRVCVLWDMNRPIPYCVEVKIGEDFALYQPLVFKNMPFTCFKCNGHSHIAKDCRKKEAPDNPAGVGYPDSRDGNLNRRGGLTQPNGRQPQYQEQQFTSARANWQQRAAAGYPRNEEQVPLSSEDRREEQQQFTEERRYETTLNPEKDTRYQAGHTPTAPLAMNTGLEDLQPSHRSYTPAYRTLEDQQNTHQVMQAAAIGNSIDQNVVVTPLVRRPAGYPAKGEGVTNMTRDETPENSNVEMAEIDKNELVRFRLWEKQGGRKQDERSPGTPSHQQKASPANKKNRKSTGDLFPAPRDVTPNWQKRTTDKEATTSILVDIAEGNEMLIDTVGVTQNPTTEQISSGTPGRRGEERRTPPASLSNKKTPARQ